MTTYNAIEVLIDNKSADADTLKKLIFEAYHNNKIDGNEFEELHDKVDRKFLFNLIKWDAFGDYEVIKCGRTYSHCVETADALSEDADKTWHTYEIVPYTPF